VSVTLAECDSPVFVLEANYIAERFVVSDDAGTNWDIETPAAVDGVVPGVSGLQGTGLVYDEPLDNIVNTEAKGLVHDTTYTYSASRFDDDVPEAWSATFTYSCPSAPSDE